MPKVRILVAMLVVAMLLLPAVALAQEGSADMPGPPTCGFYGAVTLNGQSVEAGTTITAKVGGEEVVSTVTGIVIPATGTQLADDEYVINVAGSFVGETIQFVVDDGDESGTTDPVAWVTGEYTELDLNAYTEAMGTAGITLKPTEGVATNAIGVGFTPYCTVAVSFDGEKVATATVGADGTFVAGVIPTTTTVADYVIEADDGYRTAEATFAVTAAQGPKGDPGAAGAAGAAGPAGPKGSDGEDAGGTSGVLAIVALIIAVIAVILAIVFGIRGKQQPAA